MTDSKDSLRQDISKDKGQNPAKDAATVSKPLTLREQKSENRKKILAKARAAKVNLTSTQLDTMERAERAKQNRRGRKNPSIVPDRLARTSAFAPRRQGLITDSTFTRLYEVPGYSLVEVTGRELGSHHRDALYALFRLRPTRQSVPNPNYRPGTLQTPQIVFYSTETTWRDLLRLMGKVEHINNLTSLMGIFKEIKQVTFTIHHGTSLKELESIKTQRRNRLVPDVPGGLASLFDDMTWDGAKLHSKVYVKFGPTMMEFIEKANLVSLNAEVQFKLKSDFAKSFWPFIDSQPTYHYVDEDLLCKLAGRDIWAEAETSATRAQFRKDCRQAFKDMQAAGGLKDWREEVQGHGRTKSRRYHYQHAKLRQLELDLLPLGLAPGEGS